MPGLRNWMAAALWLGTVAAAHGQTIRTDSIRTHSLKEVAIPGTRNKVGADEMVLRFAPDLSKVLVQSPDIYLRQYGPTGASSISLNGLGASQTSLEWNGIPMNSPLLGQADANQFIAGGTRITRSGSSAFSSTQAAALNMATNRPDSGSSISLGQVAGTYGQASTVAGLGYNRNRLALSGRYQWTEARNDYLVKDATSPTLQKLPNARAFRRQAELHAWHSGKVLTTEAHVFASTWGRHLAPSNQSLQTITNESLYGKNNAFSLSEIFEKGKDSARVLYSILHEDYRYGFAAEHVDPQRFAFTRQQWRALYYRRWATARVGVTYEGLRESTDSIASVSHKRRYIHYILPAIYAAGQQLTLGSVFYRNTLVIIPKLLLQYGGFHFLAQRTFRPPTLNDLYFPGYGSLNVKPEKSIHLETGYSAVIRTSQNSSLQLSSLLGHYRFSNYIQSVPNNTIYQPTNLSNISNYYCNTKFSFSLCYRNTNLILVNGLSFTKIGEASGFFGSAGRQLIYTPQIQNYSSITISNHGWSFALNGKFVSKRFYTSTHQEHDPLQPFYLANARIAYTQPLRRAAISTFASAGNIFGADYAWVQSFPMPRYDFSLGLQIETRI